MSEGAEDVVEYAQLEDLLEPTLDEVDFELPTGRKVRIKSLNRDEALQIVESKKGSRDREIKMVAWAMVKPAMSYTQAAQWFAAAKAGDIQALTYKIQELSGLDDKAERQAVERFREDAVD